MVDNRSMGTHTGSTLSWIEDSSCEHYWINNMGRLKIALWVHTVDQYHSGKQVEVCWKNLNEDTLGLKMDTHWINIALGWAGWSRLAIVLWGPTLNEHTGIQLIIALCGHTLDLDQHHTDWAGLSRLTIALWGYLDQHHIGLSWLK